MVGAAIGAVHAVGALLTSRTFFQPDEYWQSLEIAHRIVFGYGYRTWEWTSDPPLRSIVHPVLFVPLYKLLDIAGTSAYALATAPAMQQALVSALGDWFAYRLIARTVGHSVALVWCVLHLSSVYWLYTASRPFSNTMEAALCSIALYYWPMSRARVLHVSRTHHTYRIALLAAWAAVLVRPTSVILWSFLGLQVLYDAWHTACCGRLLLDAVWTGAAALAIGAGLDTLYYGTWTWTPLAFVRTNLVHGLSSFYGMNSWHWYVSVGLPSILTVYTPYAFLGWWRHGTRHPALRRLFGACVGTIWVYSCLQHKEVRFLQPLVPWLHLAAALALRSASSRPIVSLRDAYAALPRWTRIWLLVQVPVLVYVCAFHARAQVQVMSYLHTLSRSMSPPRSVGFLMPCHSTPWQSHMHTPHFEAAGESGDIGLAWFLACPPPPATAAAPYWDQSDYFFHDPVTYLRTRFPPTVDPTFPPMSRTSFAPKVGHDLGWRHPWPSHLVVFSSLLANTSVSDLFYAQGYRPTKRWWNSLFHPDTHRRGDVVVLTHYSADALGSRDVNAA